MKMSLLIYDAQEIDSLFVKKPKFVPKVGMTIVSRKLNMRESLKVKKIEFDYDEPIIKVYTKSKYKKSKM